jgi:hypothetical protein
MRRLRSHPKESEKRSKNPEPNARVDLLEHAATAD